jgi:hypothetical protein
VLERGEITLSGTSDDLLQDPEVQRAFLGKRRATISSPGADPS